MSAPRFTKFTYVCKFCGAALGTYEGRTDERIVTSVCDRPDCRVQASREYKAAVPTREER